MTLYQIWDLANYIAGKFPNGNATPPTRFNLVLSGCVDEFTQSCLNEIVAATPTRKSLDFVLSTTPLQPLKETVELTPDSVGVCDLPKDYLRYIDGYVDQKVVGGNSSVKIPFRPLSILSDASFTKARGSVLLRAEVLPIAKVVDLSLYVVPYYYAPTLNYFRKPVKPYMDYCQSADNPGKIIYMPPGSKIMTVGGDNYLYDSDDNKLFDGPVVKGDMNVLPYQSKSVELEFDEQFHYKFVYMVLVKVGINIGEVDVAKYAKEMGG